MKFSLVIREAWVSALATKVSSLLVLFLAAMMCAAALLTVGRSAAVENTLKEKLNHPASRTLQVLDRTKQGFIPAHLLTQLEGFSTVERAFAQQDSVDVYNGAIGPGEDLVAQYNLTGDLKHVAHLVHGRWPARAGEGLIDARIVDKFQLAQPFGYAHRHDGAAQETTLVGSYLPRAPFESHGQGIVALTEPGPTVRALHIVAAEAEGIPQLVEQIHQLLDFPDSDDVLIQTPPSTGDLRAEVLQSLGSYGHSILLAVLGTGAALVAVVTLADVLLRRRDLGRRRALGAGRATIINLVVARSFLCGISGVALGSLGGWVANLAQGVHSPLDFVLAVDFLTVLVIVLAALCPAIYAATRDPVRVLRTP